MFATFTRPGLRPCLRRMAAALLALGASACQQPAQPWHAVDVAGSASDLRFDMTRAADGREVSARDYRGKIVLLYFGYTFCPDVCPLTLSNIAGALKEMGPGRRDVRVLFVTVDPDRDTLPVMKSYADAFGPEFVGLVGSKDEVARLAKRYRLAYSVSPDPDPAKYQVTHSSAVYVFDGAGKAKLLMTALATSDPDIAGTAADLRRMVTQKAG